MTAVQEKGCGQVIGRSLCDSLGGDCDDRPQRRVAALNRLFDFFDGHDAEEEIARLKEQDEGF